MTSYGILSLLTSNVTNRCQIVKSNGVESEKCVIHQGIPHGMISGTLLRLLIKSSYYLLIEVTNLLMTLCVGKCLGNFTLDKFFKWFCYDHFSKTFVQIV